MSDAIEPVLRGGSLPPMAACAATEMSRKAIVVAIACSICMGLSFAPVFMGTFPLFLEPVSNEFHWSAAGALAEAMSCPFKNAAKPSSNRMRSKR